MAGDTRLNPDKGEFQKEKKKWKGSVNCCLCGLRETVDHIFFQCHVAKSVGDFKAG